MQFTDYQRQINRRHSKNCLPETNTENLKDLNIQTQETILLFVYYNRIEKPNIQSLQTVQLFGRSTPTNIPYRFLIMFYINLRKKKLEEIPNNQYLVNPFHQLILFLLELLDPLGTLEGLDHLLVLWTTEKFRIPFTTKV